MTLLDPTRTRSEVPASSPPRRAADDRRVEGAGRRRRRRRRLMAWSAAPALVALAVAAALLGRAWTTEQGIAAVERSVFEPGRADDAVVWFDRSEWINVYDRAAPSFNRGVAWFADGELGRARTEFEAALRQAGEGDRCRVVVNLALTVEAQGDALVEADPHGSQALYAEAKGIAEGNPACLAQRTAGADGAGDRLQRLLDRLEDKLVVPASREVTRTRADPDSTRDPDDNFSELEQQLDENAETRSEGRELEEGVDLTPTRTPGPQW